MPSVDLSQLGDALSSRQLLMLEPGAIPLAANVAPRRMHPRRPPAVQQQQKPTLGRAAATAALASAFDGLLLLLQQQKSFCDLVQTSPERAASSLPSRSLNADSLPLFPDHCQLELLESSFACSTSTGPSEEQQKKNSNFLSPTLGGAHTSIARGHPQLLQT